MPYGRCGRCHTNFTRATPTFCPFIIIGHINFDLLVNHIMFLATPTLETILCPCLCSYIDVNLYNIPYTPQSRCYNYSDGGFAPKARSRSPTSDGKRAWVMYVCMYVCMYICMFFTYISQFTAHTEFKSVPFASPLNATLLRNEFSWVRYPTSAWHVKIAKKSTKIPE